jgi:hypothetical protein
MKQLLDPVVFSKPRCVLVGANAKAAFTASKSALKLLFGIDSDDDPPAEDSPIIESADEDDARWPI